MNSNITNNAITKIMLVIDNKINYCGEISKQTNLTYSHTTRVINDLIKNGCIEKNNERREKILTLTSKGIKLKELLIQIKQL